MKKWENPVMEELNVAETQHGGTDYTVIDYCYKDDKGYAHADFEPSHS